MNEFVLFGTSQKLRGIGKIKITVKHTEVNEGENYKYLGVHLEKPLTLQEHIQKTYEKSVSRVKLLKRIGGNISPSIAMMI